MMYMSILSDSHLILFIYIATYCIYINLPSVCISSVIFAPLANHICQKPSVPSEGFYLLSTWLGLTYAKREITAIFR
jgi:hypothetical protein